MFVDPNVGRIGCHQDTIIGLTDVTLVAERANVPELVCLVEWSIDVDHVHIQFQLIQFSLKVIPKMLWLFAGITKHQSTTWLIVSN